MIRMSGSVKGDFSALAELQAALSRAAAGALDAEIASAAATAASAAARAAYTGPVATGAMRDRCTTFEAVGGQLRTAALERYQQIQAARGIGDIEAAAAAAVEGPAAEVLAKELGK